METKFEFNGQTVTYRSGTVRDRETRRIILLKLYLACGGSENVTEVERNIMSGYAQILSHTAPFEADWRREAGDSPEKLYEGYTLYTEAPGEVYDLFRDASWNVEQPEKKS